mmetsp:Transcript_9881/g.21104  ORF Transcript_9881/g.21104 Transcript_9881/m.21104 type:complete len:260 (-) Transcript_9881:9-788(-)
MVATSNAELLIITVSLLLITENEAFGLCPSLHAGRHCCISSAQLPVNGRCVKTVSTLKLRMVSTSPPVLSKAEQGELNFKLWEAAKNGETAILESLVAAGAQINYWDPELLQSTALHWAATNGHTDTIQKLVQLGALVGPTNQFGWTALHHSANWGYADCVTALLALGADPDARSESGKTPADAAAFKGFTAIAEMLRQRSGLEGGMGGVAMQGMLEAPTLDEAPIQGFDPNNTRNQRRLTAGFDLWNDAWGPRPGPPR